MFNVRSEDGDAFFCEEDLHAFRKPTTPASANLPKRKTDDTWFCADIDIAASSSSGDIRRGLASYSSDMDVSRKYGTGGSSDDSSCGELLKFDQLVAVTTEHETSSLQYSESQFETLSPQFQSRIQQLLDDADKSITHRAGPFWAEAHSMCADPNQTCTTCTEEKPPGLKKSSNNKNGGSVDACESPIRRGTVKRGIDNRAEGNKPSTQQTMHRSLHAKSTQSSKTTSSTEIIHLESFDDDSASTVERLPQISLIDSVETATTSESFPKKELAGEDMDSLSRARQSSSETESCQQAALNGENLNDNIHMDKIDKEFLSHSLAFGLKNPHHEEMYGVSTTATTTDMTEASTVVSSSTSYLGSTSHSYLIQDMELREILKVNKSGNDPSALFPAMSDDSTIELLSDDGLDAELGALAEHNASLRFELERMEQAIKQQEEIPPELASSQGPTETNAIADARTPRISSSQKDSRKGHLAAVGVVRNLMGADYRAALPRPSPGSISDRSKGKDTLQRLPAATSSDSIRHDVDVIPQTLELDPQETSDSKGVVVSPRQSSSEQSVLNDTFNLTTKNRSTAPSPESRMKMKLRTPWKGAMYQKLRDSEHVGDSLSDLDSNKNVTYQINAKPETAERPCGSGHIFDHDGEDRKHHTPALNDSNLDSNEQKQREATDPENRGSSQKATQAKSSDVVPVVRDVSTFDDSILGDSVAEDSIFDGLQETEPRLEQRGSDDARLGDFKQVEREAMRSRKQGLSNESIGYFRKGDLTKEEVIQFQSEESGRGLKQVGSDDAHMEDGPEIPVKERWQRNSRAFRAMDKRMDDDDDNSDSTSLNEFLTELGSSSSWETISRLQKLKSIVQSKEQSDSDGKNSEKPPNNHHYIETSSKPYTHDEVTTPMGTLRFVFGESQAGIKSREIDASSDNASSVTGPVPIASRRYNVSEQQPYEIFDKGANSMELESKEFVRPREKSTVKKKEQNGADIGYNFLSTIDERPGKRRDFRSKASRKLEMGNTTLQIEQDTDSETASDHESPIANNGLSNSLDLSSDVSSPKSSFEENRQRRPWGEMKSLLDLDDEVESLPQHLDDSTNGMASETHSSAMVRNPPPYHHMASPLSQHPPPPPPPPPDLVKDGQMSPRRKMRTISPRSASLTQMSPRRKIRTISPRSASLTPNSVRQFWKQRDQAHGNAGQEMPSSIRESRKLRDHMGVNDTFDNKKLEIAMPNDQESYQQLLHQQSSSPHFPPRAGTPPFSKSFRSRREFAKMEQKRRDAKNVQTVSSRTEAILEYQTQTEKDRTLPTHGEMEHMDTTHFGHDIHDRGSQRETCSNTTTATTTETNDFHNSPRVNVTTQGGDFESQGLSNDLDDITDLASALKEIKRLRRELALARASNDGDVKQDVHTKRGTKTTTMTAKHDDQAREPYSSQKTPPSSKASHHEKLPGVSDPSFVGKISSKVVEYKNRFWGIRKYRTSSTVSLEGDSTDCTSIESESLSLFSDTSSASKRLSMNKNVIEWNNENQTIEVIARSMCSPRDSEILPRTETASKRRNWPFYRSRRVRFADGHEEFYFLSDSTRETQMKKKAEKLKHRGEWMSTLEDVIIAVENMIDQMVCPGFTKKDSPRADDMSGRLEITCSTVSSGSDPIAALRFSSGSEEEGQPGSLVDEGIYSLDPDNSGPRRSLSF